MKHTQLLLAGVFCYMQFFNVQAQLSPPAQKLLPEKKMLFSKLPEQINVSSLWIEKLFTGADIGALVSIPLTVKTLFEGVITEKVQMNANVTNINIKSTNYDGALLSVSKTVYSNLTVRYTGRIVSIHYGDVFLLSHENNTLYFKKKRQSFVITE